jgi:hypothetical protein
VSEQDPDRAIALQEYAYQFAFTTGGLAPEGRDRLAQITLSTTTAQPAFVIGILIEFEAGE